MITNEIIEGNKLIALFDGYIVKDDICYFPTSSYKWLTQYKDVSSLNYHSSWNELMPIVRKIVEYCCDDNHQEAFLSNEYTSILDIVPLAVIEDTWKVVVEFIKYYNNDNN